MGASSPGDLINVRRSILVASLIAALTLSLGPVLPAAAEPAPPVPPPTSTEQEEVRTVRKPVAPADPGLDLPVATSSQTARRTSAVDTRVVQVAESPVDEAVGVVAVTLPADSPDTEIYLRQVTDGQPGAWSRMELDDAGAEGQQVLGTDATIVTGADSVQVATVSSEPVPAELMLLTSTQASADATASDLAWSDPAIRSRRSWGADESLVRNPYTYAQVTGAMIHHTAGSNNYTADQVPSILRSIQAYHVNGRGWNDIAYNVLVDKFGRAWEGRGGGVDRAVQGGHAWGVTNARVFGISLMGDHEAVRPTAAAIDTLSRVIAWKFRIHYVDPYGTTWGSAGQDGGDTFLNAISGHRDENATSCPGKYVYEQFSSIRSTVASYMATVYTRTGLEGYKPGNLISNQRFHDVGAMSEQGVRDFLAEKGAACVPNPNGTPCLKDFRTTIPAVAATSFCAAVAGGGVDAAGVISRVGTACGINPQVLLALIQRESSLVTGSRPTATMYAKATGSGCPDFMGCDPNQASFFGQVYGAAERFKKYEANPRGYAYRADGTSQRVQYHPEATCGTASFVIENQATANLYIYTPYTANKASLDAITGTGDVCSAYGNRNFYRLMSQWFAANGDATAAPVAPQPASTVTPAWAAISAKASALGASYTGAERGPVVAISGGANKTYANLTIHWSPSTGAVASNHDAIRDAWVRFGREAGTLGWPTSDQVCGLTGGGCRQAFQKGTIEWTAATGARVSYYDAIRDAWLRTGAERGTLGWPTGEQECGLAGRGCRQAFQKGTIEWTAATGARVSYYDAIRDRWAASGFESGYLGWPTGDQQCGLTGRGCRQAFQRGTIEWTAATGARVSYYDDIRVLWGTLGYEKGRLGWPTTEQECAAGACTQGFQGGTIRWTAATKAYVV